MPADRWPGVEEFATRLETGSTTPTLLPQPKPPNRLIPAAIGVVIVVVVALVVWRVFIASADALDANAVVVFPLVGSPAGANPEGVGEDVAFAIGTALEHTEPLTWHDGWRWMDREQRRDPARLTAKEANRITRDRGARWYVEGTLSRRGDYVTVVLRLLDAQGDVVIGRETSAGHVSQAAQTALRAVNKLLPKLLAPGRTIDLAALLERNPGAIASWLQGEREYRRANFEAAYGYLERAVRQDSLLRHCEARRRQTGSTRCPRRPRSHRWRSRESSCCRHARPNSRVASSRISRDRRIRRCGG
jgi:hypothetical protein